VLERVWGGSCGLKRRKKECRPPSPRTGEARLEKNLKEARPRREEGRGTPIPRKKREERNGDFRPRELMKKGSKSQP
jgi:hypothetical protein